MLDFRTYITEATNAHMTHIADLPFIEGVEGTRKAIAYLHDLRDFLNGSPSSHTASKNKMSVKFDGCVHEDTIVMTEFGDIPIKELISRVEQGEKINVYSIDFSLDIPIRKLTPIINTSVSTGVKSWVDIQLENGSSVKLTEDHEVYTTNRGWVSAGTLEINDDILEFSPKNKSASIKFV